MTPHENTPLIPKCGAFHQINFFSKSVELKINRKGEIEEGLLYIQGDRRYNSNVVCGPCSDPDSNSTNAKRCSRDNHSHLITDQLSDYTNELLLI